MLGVRLSLAPAPKEAQVGHRCNALPVEVWIILGKIAMRIFFKIGPCSFTHKFVVLEEFLSHHCFKLG